MEEKLCLFTHGFLLELKYVPSFTLFEILNLSTILHYKSHAFGFFKGVIASHMFSLPYFLSCLNFVIFKHFQIFIYFVF